MGVPSGIIAMTFGAVLQKKLSAREDGVGITRVRIYPFTRFRGRLGDGEEYAARVFLPFRRCCGSSAERCEQQDCGNPISVYQNTLLNARPKPATSYEMPQRSRKPWLWSVSPKPGETDHVTPFGSCHARIGAR
jgi:hypothetical protein